MPVLASDSFNRANSTNSLGSTDSYAGGTNKTYTVLSNGVWGINNNQAYMSTAYADSMAVVSTQADNVTIQLDQTVNTLQTYGIAFRVQNAGNFFRAYALPTACYIDIQTGYGATTNVATKTGLSNTYPLTLKIQLSGNNIYLYINGTLQLSTSNANMNTAIQHGLYAANTTAGGWDNLQISSSGTIYSDTPTGTGAASGTDSPIQIFAASGTGSGAATANANIGSVYTDTPTGTGAATCSANIAYVYEVTATGTGIATASTSTTIPGMGIGTGISSNTAVPIDIIFGMVTGAGSAAGVANQTWVEMDQATANGQGWMDAQLPGVGGYTKEIKEFGFLST